MQPFDKTQDVTCPECGKQTEGINHNERGLRCTNCFAMLPAPAAPAAKAALIGERQTPKVPTMPVKGKG